MTRLTPSDVAQMVADACHQCLSDIGEFVEVDWTEKGDVVLSLRDDGSVFYKARATFTVGAPEPVNDQ